MGAHRSTPAPGPRTYLTAAVAAALMAIANYLLGRFFAAHGLHGETTYIGEVLLAVFTGTLVLAFDSARQRDRKRANEIKATNDELMKQSEAVRRLSGQLMTLQDEERRRIARNLHDSVGQLVVAASLQVSAAREEEGGLTQRAGSSLVEASALLHQISEEIRTISHLLHPPLLDEVGLESALRCYVEGFAKRSKISVQLEMVTIPGRLSQDHETSIFRIVQESLTNIHRHSGSQTALVRIQNSGGELRLEVRDEGRGIPPEMLMPGTIRGVGVGLQGVRERVRELGGKLDIVSQVGHGTVLMATLPLSSSSAQYRSPNAA
jgi:signal transduction histidine kinase